MGAVPPLRGKPELRAEVARLMAAAVEQFPDADSIEFTGQTSYDEPIIAVWKDGKATQYIEES